MIHSKSRYYFTKLSDDDKEIYKQILAGWSDLNKTVSFGLPLTSSPDVSKIVETLQWTIRGCFLLILAEFN